MSAPTIPAPIRIDPAAVYTVAAVVLALDVPSATIRRAIRCGELPAVRRGHRAYIAGRRDRPGRSGAGPRVAPGDGTRRRFGQAPTWLTPPVRGTVSRATLLSGHQTRNPGRPDPGQAWPGKPPTAVVTPMSLPHGKV